MKKITAFAAAVFAAITMTASGYAQEPEYYEPAVVYINSDTGSGNYTEYDPGDEYDKLYLEDSAQPSASAAAGTESARQSYSAQDILKMVGISAVIGIIIALVICLIMKSRMKTAVPKKTANDYIRRNSFNITRSRDIFIYANVTKKKRQKQENKK